MSGKKSELRPEYPARLIRSGVRGKYAKRKSSTTGAPRSSCRWECA